MLSYRHAFHAGNFADVLKHYVLVEILHYLCKKDKAFDYIDTHAGSGMYSLLSKEAKLNQEYQSGIGLWFQNIPAESLPDLGHYLDLIKGLNLQGLRYYPGSPVLAQSCLREQDKLWCFELHPKDFLSLRKELGEGKNIHLRQEDGFKGLLSLLPSSSRRALVLIDPPYEIKNDYQQVIDTLITAYKKMPTACYALWYPVVERERINKLEKQIKKSELNDVCLFELGISGDTSGHGMTASGMIVVNPPYTLFNQMKNLLPELAKAFSVDKQLHYRCLRLKEETGPPK